MNASPWKMIEGRHVSISSRTPEGFPSRCPLCGADTNLEFSEPSGDAPCPQCGHLVWHSTQLLASFQRQLAGALGVSAEGVKPDTTFSELGADSLDVAELVMELEEEFDVAIPDDAAEGIQTVGDAIRYLGQQLRKRQG